jgi:carboxyl-terminal processing protease
MNRHLPSVLLVLLMVCANCAPFGSVPMVTDALPSATPMTADPTPIPTLTPPSVPPTDPQLLNGIWRTNGDGWLIEIDDGACQVYEQTSVSCLPAMDGHVEGNTLVFEDHVPIMAGIVEGKLVGTWYDTVAIFADRLDVLPEACTNSSTQDSQDPEWNFEVFWHTFAEHYAFFDLHQVDWQARYETYRPSVTASTTRRELFGILVDLVEPLSDPHIYLARGASSVYSPDQPQLWAPTWPTMEGLLKSSYLHSEMHRAGNDKLFYGMLDEDIGYLSILTMVGFAAEQEEEQKVLAEALDQILSEFKDANALIIDVRLNSGGFDANALLIASRFADQQRLVFSRQTRQGDGYTPLREFRVEPRGERQFTKPVVVLTSRATLSAGEIFVMSMRVFPHVTVVGEATAGAHSETLEKSLPNGWRFSLSNQVCTAHDGQVYEGVGIPPNVEVEVSSRAPGSDRDPVLDKALEILAADQ